MMQSHGKELTLVYNTASFPNSVDESFRRQLVGSDEVTSIRIEVRKSDDENSKSLIMWKSILDVVYGTFPSLTKLSLSCFFDNMGHHALRVSEIAEILQHFPTLKDLQLRGIGLSMESDQSARNEIGPFEGLKGVVESHQNIFSIELKEIYFVKQNRPDSWLLYSQLVQAISSASTLSSLSLSSTTSYYSRPILTLSALHSVLAHGRLETLSINHFNLWGAGSAVHCAESIRRNSRLTELALTACVFAATEHRGTGDDEIESSSILLGLDKNKSIKQLDLSASVLPLEVAGLSTALLENESLESLTLNRARMGFDPALHGGRLCRILKSISSHPCLRELHLTDAVDTQPLFRKNDAIACDSSLLWVRAFLHAVLEVVSANRIVSKVSLDSVMVKSFLETNICTDCTTTIIQIGITTGLNRARYWRLTPDTSSSQRWVEALVRVGSGGVELESVLTSTLFQILSSNPLICCVK